MRVASVIVNVLLGVALHFFMVAGTVPDLPLLPETFAAPIGILTVLWAAILILVVVRWFVALGAFGLARVASGFGAVPFSVVAVGAAAFLMTAVNTPGTGLSRASLLIAASCAAAFLLSWSAVAWRAGKPAKSLLIVVFLSASVLLPVTFQKSDRWKGFLEPGEAPAAPVTADKKGKAAT
jgi:hypothetical protein